MIEIEPGPSFKGETYISCNSHLTVGPNSGWGRGAIFEGMTLHDLDGFLAAHRECRSPRKPRAPKKRREP